MSDLKLFFINLDRATDRADYMWSEIDKLGLRAQTERFPALDADADGIRNGFKRSILTTNYALDPTQIACFESHRGVWKHIVDTGLKQALILEDDLLFGPRFTEALTQVFDHAEDYDLIKIDGVRSLQRLSNPQACGTVELRNLDIISYSSAGYMVSHEGAKRLLRETESYNHGIDLEILRPRRGWRMRQLFPAICVQGMFLPQEDQAKLPECIAGGQRKDHPDHKGPYDDEPWWFTVKRIVQVRLFERLPSLLWERRAYLRSGGTIENIALQDDFARYK